MSIVTLICPDQKASSALVRSSACRGYVVELDPQSDGPPKMLENLMGNVVHFRSLDRVRDALRQRGVRHATLVQQHACEELGALGVSTRKEVGVSVLYEADS
ncbi:hypothetical protein EYC98_08385 [Halieaceae bacterium IMCC14734]|uniref:Uncharacterized protein n=1 Tax=Candidatus Litorirhabdus singularis TaxID=2518993 RepID=A0ABT3TGJ2_9GAMM|nr:hypothetical protein [Candidatus Litorirhabdus singularis]MCX2980881.1 hypothetical protein [Candidatus Litorirhabdus singularis]